MHSGKDGNVITKVQFDKKKIVLHFDNEDRLEISESTYSHFYLYGDKQLSEEEIKEIRDYEALSKGKEYALGLLNKSLYSEKEIREKLYTKQKLHKNQVEAIIQELEDIGLLDDDNYVEEYLELYDHKNYGQKRILHELEKAGIEKEKLMRIVFDEENELDKARAEVEKFIKTNPNKNKAKLESSAYAHLMLYGFTSEASAKAIGIIEENHDEEQDKELLRKQLEKTILLKRIDLKDKEAVRKLTESFLRKGYRYEDIVNELRRCDENE